MQIKFENLIKVTPFDEETRNQILSQSQTLTDDQKFELTELAWKMLAHSYQADLKEKTDLILLEVSQGKRTYNKNDFVEVEVGLYQDLSRKLEVLEQEEGLKQVRQEIQKHIK